MPAKRKKQQRQESQRQKKQQHRSPTTRPSFLDLPLEVRQVIYELYYLPGLASSPQNALAQPEGDVNAAESGCEQSRDRQKSTERQHHPPSRLHLTAVCRQIRDECYPMFARTHHLSFTNPLDFANDYLSQIPPRRYSDLRYLAITWQAMIPKCKCEGRSTRACRFHPAKHAPISRDMHNLIQMVPTYPDVFNNINSLILTFHTDDIFRVDSSFTVMIKTATTLVEAMDACRRRSVFSTNNQRYIVAVHSYGDPDFDYTCCLSIFVVPDEIWDMISDRSIMRYRKPTSPNHNGDLPHWFPSMWHHVDVFTWATRHAAVYCHLCECRNGQFDNDQEQRLSKGMTTRNWKVVFQLPRHLRRWGNLFDAQTPCNSCRL